MGENGTSTTVVDIQTEMMNARTPHYTISFIICAYWLLQTYYNAFETVEYICNLSSLQVSLIFQNQYIKLKNGTLMIYSEVTVMTNAINLKPCTTMKILVILSTGWGPIAINPHNNFSLQLHPPVHFVMKCTRIDSVTSSS